MWRINCFTLLCLIIGSLADDSEDNSSIDGETPPLLLENACEITGFSVFHKKPRESTPLQAVTGRILLDDYPQGRINIKTDVDSLPGCDLPECVILELVPNFYRFVEEYTKISYQNVAPYTLYPNVNKPQKQVLGVNVLSAAAFQTSDCSGTPYSSSSQDVYVVLNKIESFTYPPTIIVYEGTSYPVTNADTMLFGTTTCQFLRDALGNGFFFNRNDGNEGIPDTSMTEFNCVFKLLEIDIGGPLQIEYQFNMTYEVSREVNPNDFLSQGHPEFYEPWTAILNYFLDMPVRTVGTTEEVMSTRIKSQIALNSPYQQYTNTILTVDPYTRVFQVEDIIVSYIGTGGVPVTASNRASLVNATCAFLTENLPYAHTEGGQSTTVTKCRLKSHDSKSIPLKITYDIEVRLDVGPELSPDTIYLGDKANSDFVFFIQVMFEDRYSAFDFEGPEMSIVVKSAIGPSNPYFNYTSITIKPFLQY